MVALEAMACTEHKTFIPRKHVMCVQFIQNHVSHKQYPRQAKVQNDFLHHTMPHSTHLHISQSHVNVNIVKICFDSYLRSISVTFCFVLLRLLETEVESEMVDARVIEKHLNGWWSRLCICWSRVLVHLFLSNGKQIMHKSCVRIKFEEVKK